MNEHDRNNLNFILSLDQQEDFERWAKTLSMDDMNYAIELIKAETTKVIMLHAEVYDTIEDTSLARYVLKKFMK